MRKQFYLDLVARIKARVYTPVENSVNIPKVKHFDLWNRQIEYLQKESPFSFPAVFVEFMPISYETLGQNAQLATLTFRLHVVDKSKGSAADGKSSQTAFLDHLDLLDDIHYALAGWQTDYCSPLMRISSTPNHDHEEIIMETETYTTSMVDKSGVKRVIEVTASLKLNSAIGEK